MKTVSNPWVDRFNPILDIEAIREKTRLRVAPLSGLNEMPFEEAADRIKDGWERTYYPTDRNCEILLEVVQTSASHAVRNHPDKKTHLTLVYASSIDTEPYVPMMLLGPSGTGKSELGKALLRLFPKPASIKIDPNHGPFPLIAVSSIVARGLNSIVSVLKQLAPDNDEKVSLENLYQLCARHQYKCGTCCILVDELQFFTQSKSANTLVTQLLLGISYVRIPFLVIANYSLAHRLMRRNSEDLQRLIGRPITLLPDGPSTSDWLTVLNEYQLVVPTVFDFRFSDCALELWSMCAGLKRVLVRLLVLAYRLTRQAGRFHVAFNDVTLAYVSSSFSGYRSDVEALVLHGIGSSALRDDLKCPFPLDQSATEKFNLAAKDAREAKVAEAALDASLTVAERNSTKYIVNTLNSSAGEELPHKVTPKQRSKRETLSPERLNEAGERFRRGI